MATIKKKFGVRLFQLRNNAGMTQAALAAKANLSLDLISRIERGERAPSLESIERIAGALNVSCAELFNFDGEEIVALSTAPSEALELWRLLQGRRPKQVKKIREIAKVLLD
jgi:transcriptional regulator with XRE-family HTH domain